MNYQVRSKKGGIELTTSDYGRAFNTWRLLPNGAKLLEYSPTRGWVAASDPELSQIERSLKKL